MVWVLDSQKYGDDARRSGFLRRLGEDRRGRRRGAGRDLPRPSLLRWLALLAAVAGAAWLGVLGYLQLPVPDVPRVEGWPVPTLLLAEAVGAVAEREVVEPVREQIVRQAALAAVLARARE